MKLKHMNKNLTLADIVNLLLSDPHKSWSIPAAEALAAAESTEPGEESEREVNWVPRTKTSGNLH